MKKNPTTYKVGCTMHDLTSNIKHFIFTALFIIAYCLLPTAYCLLFSQGAWTQKTDFGGTARYGAVGFSIGTKGYIGTGWAFAVQQDFWEWEGDTASPAYNTWTQKADFSGTARYLAAGFSIGTKGYIGTGVGAAFYQDFWEWEGDTASPAYNTWIKKADFGGTGRYGAVGFSIGTKGYIGTGNDAAFGGKDFWEWDQTTDLWTKKTDFGGTARNTAAGFSIGTKGYIGTGNDGAYTQDFWEWNGDTASPAYNTWTKKAGFTGTTRYYAVGFSIGNKGYMGMGKDAIGNKQDFYEWDQATDSWTSKADFTGTARYGAVGFSIGVKGYIGTGYGGIPLYRDLWEFHDSTLTGVTENQLQANLSVYPNPSIGEFAIQVGSQELGVGSVGVEIYNVQGEKVYSTSTIIHQPLTIDVSSQPNGVYFLKIKTEKESYIQKIIIQK